jgi:hypothetical protein
MGEGLANKFMNLYLHLGQNFFVIMIVLTVMEIWLAVGLKLSAIQKTFVFGGVINVRGIICKSRRRWRLIIGNGHQVLEAGAGAACR